MNVPGGNMMKGAGSVSSKRSRDEAESVDSAGASSGRRPIKLAAKQQRKRNEREPSRGTTLAREKGTNNQDLVGRRESATRGMRDEDEIEASSEKWEGCSLQSEDAREEELLEDEHLPIPGRESHTADLDQFEFYLDRVRKMERSPTVDTPFDEGFWDFFRTVLSRAKPIGYEGVADPKAVVPKGPTDNQRFLEKVEGTSLINPIHPILLSKAMDIPVNKVLTELLYATKAGMLTMRLTPNCLRCGSSVCAIEHATLKHLPKTAYCEGCQYRNHVDCLQKIKALFVMHPDVLYVLAENFACQPSKASMAENLLFACVPATFSGSGFRYSLGCSDMGDAGNAVAVASKEIQDMGPALRKGRYRMHCPVSRTDNYLEIERDATPEDDPVSVTIHVSDIVCKPGDCRKTLRAPHGKVRLDVWTDTKSFFVLWVQNDLDDHTLLFLPEEERKPYTQVQELLTHPTYQILFGQDTASKLTKVVKRMNSKQPAVKPNRKRKRFGRGRPA